MNLSKSKNTTKKESKKVSIKEKEEKVNRLLVHHILSKCAEYDPEIKKILDELNYFYYGIKTDRCM